MKEITPDSSESKELPFTERIIQCCGFPYEKGYHPHIKQYLKQNGAKLSTYFQIGTVLRLI